MKADVYSLMGEKVDQTELPKEFFEESVNFNLLAQATRVYLANQRKAYAKAKTRGEVDRTKAKWFRQKGTGRARHGSRSAPIFVGGGVAHGPRGNQNWHLSLTKSLRKKALFNALAVKAGGKELFVVEDLDSLKGKTREMAEFLKRIPGKEKTLLIVEKNLSNISQAVRNISYLQVRLSNSLNAYEILNGGKILVTKGSIKSLLK